MTDHTILTIAVCPDHGPFVYDPDEDADHSRRVCPAIVDYDGVTCHHAPWTTGTETFEVKRQPDNQQGQIRKDPTCP